MSHQNDINAEIGTQRERISSLKQVLPYEEISIFIIPFVLNYFQLSSAQRIKQENNV